MNEITQTSQTIFLVEEDNHARPALTKSLRQLGYRLLVAADLEDAFEWMSDVYIHADLILMNLVGKLPEEALTIGRRLRKRGKYDGHTPLVVMPEKFPEYLNGTDQKVNELEWICYYEDAEKLQLLLARLLNEIRN